MKIPPTPRTIFGIPSDNNWFVYNIKAPSYDTPIVGPPIVHPAQIRNWLQMFNHECPVIRSLKRQTRLDYITIEENSNSIGRFLQAAYN